MSNSYKLINPLIYNKNTKFVSTSKNSLAAAKDIYGSISEYFNNSVPEFYFTLEKVNNNKSLGVYHFKVNEFKSSKNANLKYKISSHTIKENNDKELLSTINEIEQKIKDMYDFSAGAEKKKKSKSKSKSKKKTTKKKNISDSSDSSDDGRTKKSKKSFKVVISDSSDSTDSDMIYNKYYEDGKMNKYIKKQIFSKKYYNDMDPLYWWYHPYMYDSPSLFLPSFVSDVPMIVEMSTSLKPTSHAIVKYPTT